jgi:polar amino acid transport system substrate-binding protein
MGGAVCLALLAIACTLHAKDAWDRTREAGVLRWGCDVTGGAPYTFPDPSNPSRIIGFEVDIMEAVAAHLGIRQKMVVVPWEELVPALNRGDFDLAFNGLEITADRQKAIDFTVPYYFFSEQITVRKGGPKFASLDDLKGKRVGTLSASLAQSLMTQHGGIEVVPYPSPVEIYRDLGLGRTQAVLLDVPIAAWYAAPDPKLENVGPPIGEGIYAGGVRKDSPRLKAALNGAFREMIRSGELRAIFEKWNIWTENQKKLDRALESDASAPARTSSINYAPMLVKGAVMTVVISLFSMTLAVLAGFGLCLGKLYGGKTLRFFCSTYVEVIRGTPLLIQLYLLYYGLPNIGVQLNAFVAAVLGMGLNYAAYEAEIYRAGLLSVPKGQDEAARSLGLTGKQSLWHVILPQAVRTILPPSTNDFIALFKDTSLVSVITVTELTRAYNVAATANYQFMQLGLLTAGVYFLMSFPLSLWSRQLEKKRHVVVH